MQTWTKSNNICCIERGNFAIRDTSDALTLTCTSAWPSAETRWDKDRAIVCVLRLHHHIFTILFILLYLFNSAVRPRLCFHSAAGYSSFCPECAIMTLSEIIGLTFSAKMYPFLFDHCPFSVKTILFKIYNLDLYLLLIYF